MNEQPILREDRGSVCYLTLNRPEKLNARVIARLADLDQAVVAVVRGHCYTGGLELALAADLILASETARIGDTHSRFALRPIWGLLQRLPRRVGLSVTKDMFCTNRVLSGREAERVGLANYCFPDDVLWEEAGRIIDKIAANSPYSISYMKRMLRETDGQSLAVGLQREVGVVYDGILGPDFAERISVLTKKK